MQEEIKNEEIDIDKKINELLNDPLVKTEEEKNFLKDVGDSLKKGEVPLNLMLSKTNEAIAKLDDLKKNNPQFESFATYYQNQINEATKQMTEFLKNQSSGK